MISITVYRNLDQKQVLIMMGKDIVQALNRLEGWMDNNNGEPDPHSPFEADGLTIFNANNDDGNITLLRCEHYMQWNIECSNYPQHPEYFDTWEEARDSFLNSVASFGELHK